MKRVYTVFIAVLLALALGGCNGAGGELSKAGPDDTPAPPASQGDQHREPGPEGTPAPEHHAESSPKQEHHAESPPAPENSAPAEAEAMLTVEQAKEKALAHAGLDAENVEFTKAEPDYEDGRQVYELEFYTDTYAEYEYEIDAYTGEVVSYKEEAAGQGHGNGHGGGHGQGHAGLTGREAKDLAAGRVPGASREDILEFGRDSDDGRDVFEGKLVYGGIEYEFEIDAGTGEFLEWEQEPWDD